MIYYFSYIIPDARIRALAAAWARNDFTLAGAFLLNRDSFGLVEVLKALQLLDAGRQIRTKEKQMKRLQVSKNKVLPKTIGKLKSDIDNLNAIKSPVSLRCLLFVLILFLCVQFIIQLINSLIKFAISQIYT